jgi:CYTH domain-containing protein
MAKEIERKFLVSSDAWKESAKAERITQGYLSRDPDRTVRVRLKGEKAFMTIKGRTEGISRTEIEFPIPTKEARELLELCLPTVIDKTRHEVMHAGMKWEVDVFHGANEGLVVAEIELQEENAEFEKPAWVGVEVSDDPRYLNARLSEHPYQSWVGE